MDYSDGVYAISTKWEQLLKNEDEMEQFIIPLLNLTPFDTRRKVVNGKQQKAVQVYHLQKSIRNNTDPEKKGLTYLLMRALHYWKTIYDGAINNPEKIEETKGKFVSRHMYESVIDDFHIEMNKLIDQMDSKNVVSKDKLREVEEERDTLQLKYNNLKAECQQQKETDQKFYDKLMEQQEEKHNKQLDFWKNRCSDMAKGIKSFPEAPLDDEH